MKTVNPKTGILPEAQQWLWPKLSSIGRNFVLYGGTAVALRYGHRQSVDFDFFTHRPFDPDELKSNLDWLGDSQTLQVAANTLAALVQTPPGEVKCSFFGGLSFGRIASPSVCVGTTVQIASPLDLSVQKLKVIQVRSESKDYHDLDCLFRNGVSLEESVGAALALYPDFPTAVALRALCYFDDGDVATIPEAMKQRLRTLAAEFSGERPMRRESLLLGN
ncbi:MAG: nucleotidyl transferase AbiEii/AbiGii toxin family protein [Puniceicoccaceae bacterium]